MASILICVGRKWPWIGLKNWESARVVKQRWETEKHKGSFFKLTDHVCCFKSHRALLIIKNGCLCPIPLGLHSWCLPQGHYYKPFSHFFYFMFPHPCISAKNPFSTVFWFFEISDYLLALYCERWEFKSRTEWPLSLPHPAPPAVGALTSQRGYVTSFSKSAFTFCIMPAVEPLFMAASHGGL